MVGSIHLTTLSLRSLYLQQMVSDTETIADQSREYETVERSVLNGTPVSQPLLPKLWDLCKDGPERM